MSAKLNRADLPQLKVVLLGKEYTGKTSLIERYIYNRFRGNDLHKYQATIGAAYTSKVMDVAGQQIKLSVWDTAGAERYQAMSAVYYRGAHAAIICYDITDGQSFEKAKFWVTELRKQEESCKLYLCGTKVDLIEADKNERNVDFHNAQDYADDIKAKLFETSSKTGNGINELFFKIAIDFATDPKNSKPAITEDSIQLDMERGSFRKSCCS